jgi:hypothetical protein
MWRPLNKPLNIVPLNNVSRPWTASSLELAPSVSVGLRRLMGRLAGFAYAPDQVYWIGAPPSNIQEFSVGDTSVGDGLTLHPFNTMNIRMNVVNPTLGVVLCVVSTVKGV